MSNLGPILPVSPQAQSAGTSMVAIWPGNLCAACHASDPSGLRSSGVELLPTQSELALASPSKSEVNGASY